MNYSRPIKRQCMTLSCFTCTYIHARICIEMLCIAHIQGLIMYITLYKVYYIVYMLVVLKIQCTYSWISPTNDVMGSS